MSNSFQPDRLAPTNHLATIVPVSEMDGAGEHRPKVRPTVLTLPCKLFGNACILATPLIITVAAVGLGQLVAWAAGLNGFIVVLPSLVVAVGLQVAWAATFPEWPENQWLARRMRREVRRRDGSGGRLPSQILDSRMVEWVPRENWQATKLDTAEDVMLIHVDDNGVLMEGDRQRYFFPPASIIDVEVQSIRPRGCFHTLHFIIMTVRTESGPLEFPISYRDAHFGGLRSSARLRESQELQCRIQSIASGGGFTYPSESAYCDTRHENVPPPKLNVANPYAAPRAI